MLRERLFLQDVIPDDDLADDKEPPYIRFDEGSVEQEYMLGRRKALDGPLPSRVVRTKRPLGMPEDKPFDEVLAGSGKQEVSTTMAFTRLLRNLCRDPNVGRRVVPIIPDEARTFGMDAVQGVQDLRRRAGLRARRRPAAAVLQRGEGRPGAGGGHHRGGLHALHRRRHQLRPPASRCRRSSPSTRCSASSGSATSSGRRPTPGQGFLLGATAGRTTLLGEGLQHQDGHSLVLASTVPTVEAWDPAFAYEMATIVRQGIREMLVDERDVVYYLTLYNENYLMPPLPEGRGGGHPRGLYRWADAPRGRRTGPRSCSPAPPRGGRGRAGRAGRAVGRGRRAVVRHQLQAPAGGRPVGRALEPPPPHGGAPDPSSPTCSGPTAGPAVAAATAGGARPGGPVVPQPSCRSAPTGRPVGHPGAPAGVLRGGHAAGGGGHAVGLAQQGEVKAETVAEAIAHYGIDVDRPDPRAADL